MSKLHWSTVHINCSPLYLYLQTIACKFSEHGWYFQGGRGHGSPWFFFQGGRLPILPPRAGDPERTCVHKTRRIVTRIRSRKRNDFHPATVNFDLPPLSSNLT